MINNVKKMDKLILFFLLLLIGIGIVFIYSASYNKLGNTVILKNFYLKQIFWSFIALSLFFGIIKLPLYFIESMIFPMYFLSLLLLTIVFFMPAINGSRRWLMLANMRFQPSEFAKVATVLFLAKSISQHNLNNWQIFFRGVAIVLFPLVLVLLEPDLGTSLIFIMILFVMFLASDLPNFITVLFLAPILSLICSFNWYILGIYFIILSIYLLKNKLSSAFISLIIVINLFIAIFTPIMWNTLHSYQQDRILTFIDPMHDPLGAGYQIIQSKIAVGSGGVLGKGFLVGTQKNLNFIPEHHTDFIFSVIGEEMGFIGSFVLLSIFLFLLIRIAKRTSEMKIQERKIASIGFIAILTFQILVNVGMNLGTIPTTGMALPFISYGGSNLIINVLSIALIEKFIIGEN
jgi:rod shape determining protein RodA